MWNWGTRQSPRAKESLLLRSQKESTHIYSTVGQGLEMREYLARLQQNMLSFNRTRMVSSIRVIAMSTAIQSGKVSKSLSNACRKCLAVFRVCRICRICPLCVRQQTVPLCVVVLKLWRSWFIPGDEGIIDALRTEAAAKDSVWCSATAATFLLNTALLEALIVSHYELHKAGCCNCEFNPMSKCLGDDFCLILIRCPRKSWCEID